MSLLNGVAGLRSMASRRVGSTRARGSSEPARRASDPSLAALGRQRDVSARARATSGSARDSSDGARVVVTPARGSSSGARVVVTPARGSSGGARVVVTPARGSSGGARGSLGLLDAVHRGEGDDLGLDVDASDDAVDERNLEEAAPFHGLDL